MSNKIEREVARAKIFAECLHQGYSTEDARRISLEEVPEPQEPRPAKTKH